MCLIYFLVIHDKNGGYQRDGHNSSKIKLDFPLRKINTLFNSCRKFVPHSSKLNAGEFSLRAVVD